jgi:5'-nucleotidase
MATILITNDDGIHSPGLKAAVEAVLPLGRVIVVAPSSQQTSSGRSFKGDRASYLKRVEYRVNGADVEAYHAECTPARIVLHAFDVLFCKQKPDLVVSGINYGENLGSNVTISGTIGAVLQSATQGVPGLAVALQTHIADHHSHADKEWTAAIHFTRRFAGLMLGKTMPEDVDILNVNVPVTANVETDIRWTRLSRQPYFGNSISNPSLESRIGDARCCYAYDVARLEPDSDIRMFLDGFVPVSPMSLDLTSRVNIESLSPKFCLPEC